MTKLTSFALRMQPEVKAAAEALGPLKALDRKWKNEAGETVTTGLYFDSINSALNTLIREGMKSILEIIEADIVLYRGALDIVQDMARVLLDNPCLTKLEPHNVPEGSARRILDKAAAFEAYWERGDVEEPEPRIDLSDAEEEVWQQISLIGGTWISRADVMKGLASIQERLSLLVAAKGALLRGAERRA